MAAKEDRTELGEILYRFRRTFYAVAAFSFVINFLSLVPPLYMLQVYDRVLRSENVTTLLMLTLIAVFAYGLQALLQHVRSKVLVRVGNNFDMQLNRRVFMAAFERSLRREQGSPAQATQDINRVRQFFTGNALVAFFDVPWTPIFIAVTFIMHPLLGFIATFGAIAIIFMAWITQMVTNQPLSEANKASLQAGNFANTHLHNAEVIEAMGMLPGMRERWFNHHHRMLGQQSLASDRDGRIRSVTRFIRISLQSIILGAGAWLVINGGQITAGMMIVGSILLGQALRPVEQLIGSWKQTIDARTAYKRLDGILDSAPQRETNLSLPAPTGRLDLDNVFAGPPGASSMVLNGVTFSVEAGDAVGLVGPTGAGKSTLARLLVGVWGARVGTVRLDSADIYRWNKEELGPYIGYLPQDVELFDGTVAENIARFTEPDSEMVVRAAEQAGVHDMILHLPEGYETRLGTDGSALSGGQRQRVALARAVYGDPVVVVLDEPNSNLDDTGETALVRTLQSLNARGATVIIITHRTNVLNTVNKLLVMQNGGIALYGERGEVLKKLEQQKMQTLSHEQTGS